MKYARLAVLVIAAAGGGIGSVLASLDILMRITVPAAVDYS